MRAPTSRRLPREISLLLKSSAVTGMLHSIPASQNSVSVTMPAHGAYQTTVVQANIDKCACCAHACSILERIDLSFSVGGEPMLPCRARSFTHANNDETALTRRSK